MAYGLGGVGLAGYGLDQKQGAMRMMGDAAQQEQQRNIKNEQIRAQRKAGNQQLGSTLGAMGGMYIGASYGSAGGPIGAAIGALVGAAAGSLF